MSATVEKSDRYKWPLKGFEAAQGQVPVEQQQANRRAMQMNSGNLNISYLRNPIRPRERNAA